MSAKGGPSIGASGSHSDAHGTGKSEAEVRPSSDDVPHGVGPASWAAAAELDGAAAEPDSKTKELLDANAVHGTAVALDGRGLLLIGGSGSGKSATALQLISFGAELVADDLVMTARSADDVILSPRAGFEGLIEARGVGILRLAFAGPVPLRVVVDLDQTELHRLPRRRSHEILGVNVHLVYGRENWALVPSLLALLRGELWDGCGTG